jgi:CheY-like chemotaxis protein/anti-sigma regulatory factor (Ser/Thr protein kinase)
MGDSNRLQQVIWNLLSNAVKFTNKGRGRVQIVLECKDSSAEITVTDTGRGIAEEFLPYVFERFRQQDGGSSRLHGGLGLGLSIVKQLVELHGGTVSVFSEGEGSGATFTVRVPLSVVKRREVLAPEPLSFSFPGADLRCPPELEGLHVLVVDDEEDARGMLQAILETCGCRVRLAASAEECLRLMDADLPDLLVSDIGMPEEDGYGLIKKIRGRAREAGSDIPAVALTAYARTEDRTRALLSGFSTHVPKPIEPLELLAVLAALSGRARRR